jgi:peptide deformylase
MTLRPITKMGNPVLREIAKEIPLQEIKSNEIDQLIQDLHVTMKESKGLGIAAPQIGVSKQICLMEVPEYN